MLSTVVVRLHSVMETMRSAISWGSSPLKLQMMLTTGMSMLGKMSVGVRTIASDPRSRIKIASTTMVCGCFSASLTIHITRVLHLSARRGRASSTKLGLRSVLRGLDIQRRDQLLGGRRHGDSSRQDNTLRRNLPAVQASVIATVRTDRGAFKRDSGKQAARP